MLGTWWARLGLSELTWDEVFSRHSLVAMVAAGLIASCGAALLPVGARVRLRLCGVIAFSGTLLLVTAWMNSGFRRPQEAWQYIPAASLLIAVAGLIDLIRRLSPVAVWLARGTCLQVVACLLIPGGPGWEDWAPQYVWWSLAIGQSCVLGWAAWDAICLSGSSRELPWCLVMILMTCTLFAGQSFASMKDVALISGAQCAAIAVVYTIRPRAELLRGMLGSVCFVIAAVAVSSHLNDFSGIPRASFLCVIAAPLMTALADVVPGRRYRPALRLSCTAIPLLAGVVWLLATPSPW